MEYALRQAAAIALEGCEVHFLCKESFPKQRLATGIRLINLKADREPFWATGKLRTIWRLTIGSRRISQQIFEIAEKMHFEFVLFACYKEYFSPFWAGPLRQLANKGAVVGTIAHDPVRDFVMGPLWWHRWCVRLGYSFVRHVFVHDDTPLDFGGAQPQGIQIHQIPHGSYQVCDPKIGRLEMRRRLGVDSGLTTIEHWDSCENRRLGKAEGRATESWLQRGAASGTMPVIEQTKVGLKGEGVGTTESKSAAEECRNLSLRGMANTEQAKAGPCLDKPSCASESDSLPSKLADSPVSESLTRSASAPASSPATSHSLLATAPEAPSPATSYSPLATPASPDVVFLAFGQIRDGKNLDLFLRAMTRLPHHVKLLVAGKGDSGSSKPPEFYQNLAQELGVADRCRWDIRRIPEEEVGDIFAACDLVLVTYSANFRSASGVLNAAVSARKLVLASSGSGPLKTVVEKYHLGVFVEPDDLEETLRGALQLMDALSSPATQNLDNRRSTLDACFPPATTDSPHDTAGVLLPAWDRYESDNSWKENATIVMNLISSSSGNS